MEEQKPKVFSALQVAGLAAVGAVIFVGVLALLVFGSNLLTGPSSLVMMWIVFAGLLVAFVAMPLIGYKYTSSAKIAFEMVLLQIFFIVVLLFVVRPLGLWLVFMPPFSG